MKCRSYAQCVFYKKGDEADHVQCVSKKFGEGSLNGCVCICVYGPSCVCYKRHTRNGLCNVRVPYARPAILTVLRHQRCVCGVVSARASFIGMQSENIHTFRCVLNVLTIVYAGTTTTI